MVKKPDSKTARLKRHKRVRAKIAGTPERPRLAIFRSNKGIYAQIIDDVKAHTLVAASTLDKEVKTKASNIEAAREVGALIGARAVKAGIKDVVFDRGGYIYHGKVKAFAEAAREAGLEF